MRFLCSISILLLVTAGCSDDDAPVCTSGSSRPCTCSDGSSGTQSCGPDSVYGACVCAPDAGRFDATVPPDSGERDADTPVDASSMDSSMPDAATADASTPDASAADASTPPDAGPLTCAMGTEAPIGQLCVTEASTAGGPVTFEVRPFGCLSSSCTIRHTTVCNVSSSGASTFDLTALFCLEDDSGGGVCTDDCGGGGFATCSAGGVAAGSYTATLGSLSVSFTVPSSIPFGGICDGSPF